MSTGKTREKSFTMMKRARYNQLELSNSNLNMFLEYLTTLPQKGRILQYLYCSIPGGRYPRTPKEINGGLRARVYLPMLSVTTTDLTFYLNWVAALNFQVRS